MTNLQAIGTRDQIPEFSRPARRVSPPPDVLNAIQGFDTYWHGLRARIGALPRRTDLDPLEIGATALPWVVLATVLHDSEGPSLRYRLCGTGMAELLGFDLTGWLSREAVKKSNFENVMRPYLETIDQGEPTYWTTGAYHERAGWRPAARAVWPLSDDGTTVTDLVNLTVPSQGDSDITRFRPV